MCWNWRRGSEKTRNPEMKEKMSPANSTAREDATEAADASFYMTTRETREENLQGTETEAMKEGPETKAGKQDNSTEVEAQVETEEELS